MGNNAVNVNPPYGSDIHITNRGSSFLWAVFSIFAVATLVFLFVSHRRAARDRFFGYFTIAITLVSTLTYFALASNLGHTSVPVEFVRSGSRVSGLTRQVFWVRYIQWFINIILIVLALLLTARVNTPQILFTLLTAGSTIIFGLAGALVSTRYKWGFYAIAIVIFLYVVYALFRPGRRHSNALGTDVGRAFKLPSLYALAILLFYPIAWGVSEGGNVIAPDSEAVFYGVLDLFLFIGFGALLIFSHRTIEPSRLGLRMRNHDEELAGHHGGRHNDEKHGHNGHNGTTAAFTADSAHNGTHNGTHNGVPGTHNNGVPGTHHNGVPGTHHNVVPGTHHNGVGQHAQHSTIPTTAHTGVASRV